VTRPRISSAWPHLTLRGRSRGRSRASRPLSRIILLSALVLLAAACSSSGGSAGSPASAGSPTSAGSSSPSAVAPSAAGSASSSTLCADVAALRASVQKLTTIRPRAGAASQLKTAGQDIQSNLSSLTSAAGDQWGGPIANLKTALTSLQSAVSTLATQRNASSVSSVVSAIKGVSTATQQLLTAANPSCPSPSAGT
jgi:hypothetical protein